MKPWQKNREINKISHVRNRAILICCLSYNYTIVQLFIQKSVQRNRGVDLRAHRFHQGQLSWGVATFRRGIGSGGAGDHVVARIPQGPRLPADELQD